MADFEARHVIEALRSGVSSRAVGQYFSYARQDLLSHISQKISDVGEGKISDGMVIAGKYGEGKTHLLNTVFNLAQSSNMVVSFVSLSKETPFNKLDLVYQKLLHNTYLPKRLQPGFGHVLHNLTPNSPLTSDILAFTAKQLRTDKLFYLFRSFLNTEDMDEKYRLLADLEGDFIANAVLKQIYRRIFSEKVTYNVNFSKTKHMDDYFTMLSHLFLKLGYNGWVILFDETELVGRLGKKSRLNAYKNMASFLFGEEFSRLQATYSIFALTASYLEDVIEGKNEFENLNQAELDPDSRTAIEKTLKALVSARQLQPLNKNEIDETMRLLVAFYQRAYDWEPVSDIREVLAKADGHSYLLRTRIRAAVECLDQMYQYHKVSHIGANQLGEVGYEEEADADIPLLDLTEIE